MIVYDCEDCECTVTASPFRQSCPACGRVLRPLGTTDDHGGGL